MESISQVTDSNPEARLPVLKPAEDADPRQSLSHVLQTSEASDASARQPRPPAPGRQSSTSRSRGRGREAKDHEADEKSFQNDSYTRSATDINPSYTMTVVHSRRNANGTIGSVYSGNKIRHLKKEDGVPLWRKDIQFAFLHAVFHDPSPVFTAMDGSKGHNFADIYIQAMATSSKTSKILMQKLLTDRESAVNMAMICLLVNVGRMNTTLNFFPEMRAQLRTYHSIPCLQAHQDATAYKQLQDAPRLKSILKGACEDSDQPNSIEKVMAASIPRTNPVNLIFVLSQYAPKISEAHFRQPRDFFDLVIRSTLSSKSRAKAFLWLVWWYLESDFSANDALKNPFGVGQPGDEEGMPLKVPALDPLTEEQANAENIDTEEEKAFGELKRLERKRILEDDETVGPPLKKHASKHLDAPGDRRNASPSRSDMDRSRSGSPSAPTSLPKAPGRSSSSRKLTGFRNETTASRPDVDKSTPSSRLLAKATGAEERGESSSPAPQKAGQSVFRNTGSNGRRLRPETSHQKAVQKNRQMRIDNILHRKLATAQRQVLKRRARTKMVAYRAMTRIISLPDDYDSQDEGANGPGGLVPTGDEEEDYGGDAQRLGKAVRRAIRRLNREDNHVGPPRDSQEWRNTQQEKKEQARRRAAELLALHSQPDGGNLQPHGHKGDDARARLQSAQSSNGVENEMELDELDMDLLGEDREESEAEMSDLDEESGEERSGDEEALQSKSKDNSLNRVDLGMETLDYT